ncbi:MAG: cobalamin biosynthesis protein [Acidimicrobiales bacterium]
MSPARPGPFVARSPSLAGGPGSLTAGPGSLTAAMGKRAGAVAVGLVADAVLGEVPSWHPVAGFGSAMERLEGRWWADDRLRGTVFAAAGIAAAAATGRGATAAVGPGPALAAATWVSAAGRALLGAAAEVGAALSAGEIEVARRLLPSLVGRSPDGLDEKEVARAVIESLADNLSDAVVGTAVWGVLAAAPGALVHRAANTLDAMVGYRSDRYRRFGWASARADDVLGWPAARLTAVLVALASPSRAAAVWAAVRGDARAHPSPNAGVAEAAFAAALGLRLGGANRYGDRTEIRPYLGDGPTPEPADIGAAIDLSRRAIRLLTALMAAAGAPGLVRAALARRHR